MHVRDTLAWHVSRPGRMLAKRSGPYRAIRNYLNGDLMRFNWVKISTRLRGEVYAVCLFLFIFFLS